MTGDEPSLALKRIFYEAGTAPEHAEHGFKTVAYWGHGVLLVQQSAWNRNDDESPNTNTTCYAELTEARAIRRVVMMADRLAAKVAKDGPTP